MKPVTNNPKPISKGEWQWQSNPNPWSKTEVPQWTPYSSEHNYLIENAYYDQKKEVDLGDYIASTKDLIQKKKGMIISQRPIRRINAKDKEENNLRSQRYFETELPKTMNNIFGGLEHFISFFSRRNSDTLDFPKQFQEFEQTNDLEGLNKIIRPQLVRCLEEELVKPIEDKLKDGSITEFQKKTQLKTKKLHGGLVSLFKNELKSFEEFHGLILRSYTMNTDLYLNLNKYLRNEDWTAIDNLLPYAICLCKAFFNLKPSISLQKKKQGNSLIVYRGTAFDEFALSSYQNLKAPKLFSWNSVTSTSANREIAERFMHESANVPNKKYPVLFIIEISLGTEPNKSEYMKWIDIHQYSAISNEEEVVLAPGCAFELKKISTDKDKRTTIKIKLRHEVESLAHGGLMMQGALQTQMMSDKQARIMCLEREELSEALKSISGNRLIEEIEFYLCTFDNQSFEKMLQTLPTLENAKALKFVSCKHEDEQGISTVRLRGLKSCNILQIEAFEVQDFFKIFCSPKESGEYWMSLRELSLDLRSVKTNHFVLQELGRLSQLQSLALDFEENKAITDEALKNLASQGLRYLPQITSLALNFTRCQEITNEGVKSLACHGLKYLSQLNSLSLVLRCCRLITDKGIKCLASQGLKQLPQLTFLNLNLSICPKIGNGGVKELASQGLKNLRQLTSLTLNFETCSGIGKEVVNDLVTKGLNYLTKLTSLNLDFAFGNMTNKGINDFAFQGPKLLKQLVSLSLDLNDCNGITNMGLSIFASQALRNLTRLTSLALNFSKCAITDEGMNDLASRGLKCLTRLSSLSLNFLWCRQITDNGMKNLASKGLKSLQQLTSLVIKVSKSKITNGGLTDEGVHHFVSEGLQYLTQLASLTLDFISCEKITNKGIESLASQGIKYLTRLTSLNLNFRKCSNIGDRGIENLVFQGLQYLPGLVSLGLNFSYCEKITDEAVISLTSRRIKYLTQLNSLTLDFSGCEKITNRAVDNLRAQVLQYLTQLVTLNLNFSSCSKEAKEATDNLAYKELEHLTKLSNLILNDEAIKQSWNHRKQQKQIKFSQKSLSLTLNLLRKNAQNKAIPSLVDQQTFSRPLRDNSFQISATPSTENFERRSRERQLAAVHPLQIE